MWAQRGDWEEEAAMERLSSDSTCTGSSRSHYAVDPDSCPWPQHQEMVETSFGQVQVTVCGEATCPPLITYHDIGLNHSTCFQGMLLCEETASLLLQNFCIFHIDAPGHQAGAPETDLEEPYRSCDDLADQVAEVAQHYRLADAVCLGVSAGAYIMTLLAIRHPGLVKGLVLVSPICQAATWTEWANAKVLMATLAYYGMARSVKDFLLERFFCQDQSGYHGPGSDALISFRQELDERDPESVMRYMRAIHSRRDLTKHLKDIRAATLIVVGAMCPFAEEALHIRQHMDPGQTKLVEVDACGSLVTEERPQSMQPALRAFFSRLVPVLSPSPSWLRPLPDLDRLPSSLSLSPVCSPSLSGHSRTSSLSSRSSSPSSSSPHSPMSSFFSESRRGFLARTASAIPFEDLSLHRVQSKLKPIKIAKVRDDDSDDEDDIAPGPHLAEVGREDGVSRPMRGPSVRWKLD